MRDSINGISESIRFNDGALWKEADAEHAMQLKQISGMLNRSFVLH